MQKQQTDIIENKPHWAAGIAEATLEREHREREDREACVAAATHLSDLVRSNGSIYIERLGSELEAVTESVNARVGRPMLVVRRSLTGLFSVNAADGPYVMFVPLLNLDREASAPGVTVTIRQGGRESSTPFDFAAAGDRLVIRGMGPEAFARDVLEPWLRAVPLGGR